MKKQFIAKLLVLAMVLAMVPVTVAFAAADAAGDTQSCPSNDGCVSYSAPDTTVHVSDVPTDGGSIKVTVTNGIAKVAFNDKAVKDMADMAKDGKIELNIDDAGARKLNVSFSAKAMSEVAKESGAEVVFNSSVAKISIPNEVLSNALGTSGTVKVTAQSSTSSVGFNIQVSGRALKGVKGITVTF